MFICPVCNKQFFSEVAVTKHFLYCWKETHPNHKSKAAPRSEDIITTNINDDVMNFFNSFNND